MTKYCCSHVDNIPEIPSTLQLKYIEENTTCDDCDCTGPNLWLCLLKDCLHVGCSEKFNDHSTTHFKQNTEHSVHINLSTKRIWCYICEAEVFYRSRTIVYEASDNEEERPQSTPNPTKAIQFDSENQSTDSDELSELASIASDRRYYNSEKHIGLVGLQNIGNTCYMNSALQALSNTLPLTSYFLECGTALELVSENKKPGLSRTYQQLMKEIWNKKTRGYVVPSGILYGIRNVYPMFRGYHQHDTQEFLRCFMDQLHEELKESYLVETSQPVISSIPKQEYWRESPSPSQSDGEYETCDSGVSERSSLSDDTERVTTSSLVLSNKRKLSPNNRCKIFNQVIDSQPGGNQTGGGEGNVPKMQKTTNKYKSIISDVFDGKLSSSVQCLTCDRVSTRIETFQDLSLPIPGRDHITLLHQSGPNKVVTAMLTAKSLADGSMPAGIVTCAHAAAREGWWSLGWLWGWFRSWFYGPAVSLHDCLSAFFSADELKGDNMYSCEKCNKLRNGVKFSKVIELPEVLCIHLKRFRHELMFSSKLSNYVSFPLTGLDMRPYLHRECVSGVSEYELNSVICHHGTAGAGHYTCYALNHARNAWFEFDDQCVTEVAPETVESCEAYVLFYKKCSRKIKPVRQTVGELMEKQVAGEMRFYISRQWFTRFTTCAEPGPIDNTDFLCIHGAVKPNKILYVDKLAIAVSPPIWEYLLKTFHGGPTCNHLYECPVCGKQAEAHLRRIRFELDTFGTLNKKFQQQSTNAGGELIVSIYAISMKWFRTWQAFVKNQTDDQPGPIDNTPIIIPGTSNINLSSDYAQISEELWMFLYRIYGGGPVILLRSAHPPSSPSSGIGSEQQTSTQDEVPETEDTPLVSSISTPISSSESEGEHGQYSPLSISPPTKTFTSPATIHISADTTIPGLKRPPKVYTLHTDKYSVHLDRRTRRRRRSETSASTTSAQEHHVHGKYNKYSTGKRRPGTKKRSLRRNSDEITHQLHENSVETK